MRPLNRVWKPVLQSSVGTVNGLALIGIRLQAVPLLMRHLASERYGVWMAIASFTAYVTVLDFGVVSAVVNKLTDQLRLARGGPGGDTSLDPRRDDQAARGVSARCWRNKTPFNAE